LLESLKKPQEGMGEIGEEKGRKGCTEQTWRKRSERNRQGEGKRATEEEDTWGKKTTEKI
jgi:hypothetical protein